MDWLKAWHIFWLAAPLATAALAIRAQLAFGRRHGIRYGVPFLPPWRVLQLSPEVRDEYFLITAKWTLATFAVLMIPAAIERYGAYALMSLGWR